MIEQRFCPHIDSALWQILQYLQDMLISGIFRQMHIPILFRVNEYAKLARHICHIRIFKRIRICRPSSLCPVTSISNVCIFNIIVFNVVTLLCYYVCTLEQTWDLIVKPCAFFFFPFGYVLNVPQPRLLWQQTYKMRGSNIENSNT